MTDTPVSTEQWLQQELSFINTTMAHTLNGQLKASFVACDDQSQSLTLGFPLEGLAGQRPRHPPRRHGLYHDGSGHEHRRLLLLPVEPFRPPYP